MPPPTHEGPRGKPVTRRTVLSRRDAMSSDERARASAQIAARTTAILPTTPGKLIALYAAKGSEVDTAAIDAFARGAGHRVAYPRLVDNERTLVFHEVSLDELVPTRWGLREPLATAPAVELGDIALFVIPGLGFDRTGGRIGWGRGHYDATLAAAPNATRVGVAFECQVVDHVPSDPHDAHVDFVVTEVSTYETPR